MKSKQTFECSEWNLPEVSAKVYNNPFEENQVYISFWECPFGLREFLDKPCPKGQGLLRVYYFKPPKCPYCREDLPEMANLERERVLDSCWEYRGLEIIDFNTSLDNDLEVRCKYEAIKWQSNLL